MSSKKDQNYQNQEQDRRLDSIEASIRTINHELGEIQISMAKISSDVAWLKKFFFIVTSASISALIVGIFNLIFKFQ